MEKLIPADLAKSVGIYNFDKRQLECVIESDALVSAVNQVEKNLHKSNTHLIEICQSENITIKGY